PLVLCTRRRCRRSDHVVHPVLPRRVRGPPDARGMPVRPGRIGPLRTRRSAGMSDNQPQVEETVTFTIDGITTTAPKGSLVIRAAEEVGIQIPRFCDHPLLKPVGACRQCLVEVALPGPDGELRQMQGPPGRMKPQPSCTLVASEGMEVKTQLTSAGADKAQQGMMEFLLINHPLDCPVCDKGG